MKSRSQTQSRIEEDDEDCYVSEMGFGDGLPDSISQTLTLSVMGCYVFEIGFRRWIVGFNEERGDCYESEWQAATIASSTFQAS